MRSAVCIVGEPAPEGFEGWAVQSWVEALHASAPDVEVATAGFAPVSADGATQVAAVDVALGGDAVWASLKWALAQDYDRVVCVRPQDAPRAATQLMGKLSESDAVLGARRSHDGVPGWTGWAARAGERVAQSVFRLPFHDLTSPVMGFQRHVLEAVNLDDLRNEHVTLPVALKLRAFRLGFSIAEVNLAGLVERRWPVGGAVARSVRRVVQMGLRGR